MDEFNSSQGTCEERETKKRDVTQLIFNLVITEKEMTQLEDGKH